MPESPPESLHNRHPRRYDVPMVLVGSTLMLLVAHTLPFMVIEKFFFEDNYKLLKSVAGMWQESYYFLAILIFWFLGGISG